MEYFGTFNNLKSINNYNIHGNKLLKLTINNNTASAFENKIIKNENANQAITEFCNLVNLSKNNQDPVREILKKIINDYKKTQDTKQLKLRLNRVFFLIHEDLYA